MSGETQPLDGLCSLIVDCPHSTPVWTNGGVVVLRNQNIRNGRLKLDQPSFTDEAHYQERIRRAAPQEGDIVITREAPMGEVCMVPPNLKCCLGQRMVLLRPDPTKVDGRYLLAALQSQSVRNQISWAEGTGSTVSNLRIPDLEALRIPYRRISEQRVIAHILGTHDDKIELNRKMNETLESMARALFKSWFIDFDPVRAKVDGRWKKGQSIPGLPAELWDLFPDSLESLGDRELPKGWELTPLGNVSNILNGFAFKSEDYRDYGSFVLRTKNFGDDGYARRLKDDVYLDERIAKEYESFLVQPFDIHLVMVAASIGKTAITPPNMLPALRNQNMWCFRNKDTFPFRHYINLMIPLIASDLRGHSSGTARDFFRKGDFEKYQIVRPEPRALEHAEKFFRITFEKIAINIAEITALENLQDELLPKLISGEVQLNKPETFLKERGL